MATIDYKQKIKDYMNSSEVDTLYKSMLNNLFPELKESEDERIRKTLKEYFINSFQNNGVAAICGVHIKDIFAWLEKKGEQDAITFNDAHIIDPALNDYCCKQYNALHKENGGVLSFARLQHLAMDIYGWCKKQGEKTSDKIVEKARTEKQRVLLTETDGSAGIDWDCRSLDDVKILLKCGLEFIRTIEADKQILTDNRFGGCSFRAPTRYDKGIKQGEQKPADKVEPKFKVGDWVVVSTTEGDRVVQIVSVEYFNKDGCPIYITTEGRWFGNGTKARLLTDKDVETITIPESKIVVNKDKSWSEEDERMFNSALWHVKNSCGNGGKNSGEFEVYNWLKSLKDRVQPQPKQEWSEEDENHVKSILSTIECCRAQFPNAQSVVEAYNADIEWFISLKDRYTWKPSDEQMNALSVAVKHGQTDDPDALKKLLEQLKKLRE